MAWRTIAHGGEEWVVSIAAERRPGSAYWNLVLSFRASGPGGRRSVWAAYPLEADSKSALFIKADRLSDERLLEALTERLSALPDGGPGGRT